MGSYRTYDGDVFADFVLGNQGKKSISRDRWELYFCQYEVYLLRSSF